MSKTVPPVEEAPYLSHFSELSTPYLSHPWCRRILGKPHSVAGFRRMAETPKNKILRRRKRESACRRASPPGRKRPSAPARRAGRPLKCRSADLLMGGRWPPVQRRARRAGVRPIDGSARGRKATDSGGGGAGRRCAGSQAGEKADQAGANTATLGDRQQPPVGL